MGLLAWSVTDSTATKWSLVIALGFGGGVIGLYSIRSLMYFATLPAPRPMAQPAGSSLAIRRSLLGNTSFSATL